MVMQNAMLHTLSKTDVQAVSDRFVELRHRLVDHAEDYQRVQAATAAAADIENLSTIKAKKVATGRGMVVSEKDPLAILKAQLSHQDAKLEQLSGTTFLLSTTTTLHRPRRTHARTHPCFLSRAPSLSLWDAECDAADFRISKCKCGKSWTCLRPRTFKAETG
jgi:hypothetical protein